MTRRQWTTGLIGGVVVVAGAALVPTTATTAASPAAASSKVDASLGNGLGRLLAQSERSSLKRQGGGLRMDQESLAIRDDQDRVLIQLTPQSNVDRATFREQAEDIGLVVKAVDSEHGTLEGFTPLSAVRRLAALDGTGTIAQALKPATHVGDATSQGVALQRVDKVQARNVDGKGIAIGALSDSYDMAETDAVGDPLTIRAADDVASGDLPGPSNYRNRKRVVVIEDDTDPASDSDEGRAMLQIAHDVAPAAKLCFATAVTGLLAFADNIRRLADRSGPCGADVVVDDITYYEEPMFSDNPISDAIDDVSAKGVHYFSAAGNSGHQQSWDSPVDLVPAKRGLKGTNLNFDDVDPALYDGGLQDMNPGAGTDVAQDLKLDADTGGLFDLQWDDPLDVDGPTLGEPYLSETGEVTDADPEVSFTFTLDAADVGQQVLFETDAIPSASTDLILSVDAPDGTNLGEVDTGSSPETLAVALDQAGEYTVTVSGYDGETGDFTVDAAPILAPSTVSTDFNALLFDADGEFVGSVDEVNSLTGRPSEISPVLGGISDLQLVISRHGSGPVGATQLRNVLFGNLFIDEYSDPFSPSIFGHAMAEGATAVAAYDPWRSFLPEFFTSKGGDLPVYFDSSGNRLRRPQVRRVPPVASADGGNTTFFGIDNARDSDTQPNFFGTSASAPHAASIAALALQRAGGQRSITPNRMRERLEDSAFKHDLDPFLSRGSVGGLSVTARGPQGYEDKAVPGTMNDPQVLHPEVRRRGAARVRDVPGRDGQPDGTWRAQPAELRRHRLRPEAVRRELPFRADGFPFTVGSTSGGLVAKKVSAEFSVPGRGESVAGQFRHLTVNFKSGLKEGQALQFGVDRDLAISGFGGSNEGNGADELGGATFLPSGVAEPDGMEFVAERVDGRKIRGVISNRLGSGWTPIDGFGLIDAQEAVLGR